MFRIECISRQTKEVFAVSYAKGKKEAERLARNYGQGEQYFVSVTKVGA